MEFPQTCPVCGSTNIVNKEENKEMICKDCGNIQTEVIEG